MSTSITQLFITIFLLAANTAMSETTMLQDLCVADHSGGVSVNGYPCKDITKVTADDFYFIGLANAGNTANSTMGSAVSPANVDKIPGLNTMGISLARIDVGPGGVIAPHFHPRASEVIYVLQGRVYVGFITTSGKLFSKHLNQGDVFVFPQALLHFQHNPNTTPASVLASFDSQNPGTSLVGPALFGANPALPEDMLAKALQVTQPEIKTIKAKFAPKK